MMLTDRKTTKQNTDTQLASTMTHDITQLSRVQSYEEIAARICVLDRSNSTGKIGQKPPVNAYSLFNIS